MDKLSVRKIYSWSDNAIVLHWLKCYGKCKRFVSNRVYKIKGESFIERKYVSTKENSADLGRKGCEICKLDDK